MKAELEMLGLEQKVRLESGCVVDGRYTVGSYIFVYDCVGEEPSYMHCAAHGLLLVFMLSFWPRKR